ncbi:MAG: NAD(P)/FAD-dependent oxidoreductase [Verrucomicrobiota bacterium]
MESRPRHVVIIGGGFAGLACARKLASREAFRVTLLDRHNHHLFQPLLYQVATTTLTAPDIARSLRSLFATEKRVDVLYDEAESIHLAEKEISLASGSSLAYDALVIAAGARTTFFGNDQWASHVHQLKTLRDAMNIRRDVLRNLEYADQSSASTRELHSTVIIVGGGPTGVELAGAFCDLVKRNMKRNFRSFDPMEQRIILLEGMDRLLGAFSDELADYTKEHLTSLGVDVRTNALVEDIQHQQVTLKNGEVLRGATIIWTAGVEANPITRNLEPKIDLTRGGLVLVEPDLSIPGYPSAFVVGDAAAVKQPDGSWVPGVAPAATQGGEHVAEIISTMSLEETREHAPFRYKDKGQMAIISKGSAVVEIQDWKAKGWLGWNLWLFVHLLFLVDFRSKFAVLASWFWAYIKNVPGTRVFTESSSESAS